MGTSIEWGGPGGPGGGAEGSGSPSKLTRRLRSGEYATYERVRPPKRRSTELNRAPLKGIKGDFYEFFRI